MLRRGAAGKAGDREIHGPPEQVHGAALADEAAAEDLEHAVGLRERPPEAVDRVRIVRAVRLVRGNGMASATSFGFAEIRTGSSSRVNSSISRA